MSSDNVHPLPSSSQTPAGRQHSNDQNPPWYLRPRWRVGEILTLVAMSAGFLLFLNAYSERIALLEHEVVSLRLVVLEVNAMMPEGNPRAPMSRESKLRFDAQEKQLGVHNDRINKINQMVNELYYKSGKSRDRDDGDRR